MRFSEFIDLLVAEDEDPKQPVGIGDFDEIVNAYKSKGEKPTVGAIGASKFDVWVRNTGFAEHYVESVFDDSMFWSAMTCELTEDQEARLQDFDVDWKLEVALKVGDLNKQSGMVSDITLLRYSPKANAGKNQKKIDKAIATPDGVAAVEGIEKPYKLFGNLMVSEGGFVYERVNNRWETLGEGTPVKITVVKKNRPLRIERLMSRRIDNNSVEALRYRSCLIVGEKDIKSAFGTWVVESCDDGSSRVRARGWEHIIPDGIERVILSLRKIDEYYDSLVCEADLMAEAFLSEYSADNSRVSYQIAVDRLGSKRYKTDDRVFSTDRRFRDQLVFERLSKK